MIVAGRKKGGRVEVSSQSLMDGSDRAGLIWYTDKMVRVSLLTLWSVNSASLTYHCYYSLVCLCQTSLIRLKTFISYILATLSELYSFC